MNKKQSDSVETDPAHPFGPADGGRDSGPFIEFAEPGFWRGLSFDGTDRRCRILVGRRGSGKSRYLRQMERSVRAEGLLVFQQTNESIWLGNLHWIHKTFAKREERLEIWEALWSCAVYAGIASFLFNGRKAVESRQSLGAEELDFLDRETSDLIPRGPRPTPILGILNRIIEQYSDRSRLTSFVRDPRWFTLESIILDVITDHAPIFAFIDQLDNHYDAAPAESTDAQVGFLLWIMGKVADPTVSNRLHVVVTVRDVIFAALLQTDNGQRFNDRQHIKCLDWNDESSYHYLAEKIRLLDDGYCAGDQKAEEPLERWLGFSTIVNERRGGTEEPMKNYIMRHTRFLPRELNEIGNTISTEIFSVKARKQQIKVSQIRGVISTVARLYAERTLNEVVLHMAAVDGVEDKPRHMEIYKKQLVGLVTDFIVSLGGERFDKADLNAALELFMENAPWWKPRVAGHDIGIQDILWQHGLIGYHRSSEPSGWVRYFHATAGVAGDLVPVLPVAEYYFLHSTLLDFITLKTEAKAPEAYAD